MNYSRFYTLLRNLPWTGDREELKEQLVMQYTNNRSCHVSDMTKAEYDSCCNAMDARSGWRDNLRKRRSECLRLMQKLGIDTADWARVNAFCQDYRIAGKPFAGLSVDDLRMVSLKLRAIAGRGGLHGRNHREFRPESVTPARHTMIVRIPGDMEQN